MHIKDFRISEEWTSFTEILDGEVDAGATYTIFNISQDEIYAIENDTTPQTDALGVIVVPTDFIIYQKGEQELYLRNGSAPVTKDGVPVEDKLSAITINKVG